MKLIPLTQGKFAMVDDEDFDRVNRFKWSASHHFNTWYAARSSSKINGRRDRILLHSVIIPGHVMLDHVDRDGLNNQKYNLRPATNSQNKANGEKQLGTSSQFKGVSWRKDIKCWRSDIRVLGHLFTLGHYESEIDAAISYNHAALAYFGEYAKLNSI